jgi:hypothetical protein
MPQAFIVGRAPDDDDPIVRDGEVVRVPLLLRDGSYQGGNLIMADGAGLTHRLRFASPQVRMALGLPPQHLEDGKGNIAGHAPGYVLPPDQSASNRWPCTTDEVRRRAYADYVKRLTSAWRNP